MKIKEAANEKELFDDIITNFNTSQYVIADLDTQNIKSLSKKKKAKGKKKGKKLASHTGNILLAHKSSRKEPAQSMQMQAKDPIESMVDRFL